MSVIEFKKASAAQRVPFSRTEIVTRPWWPDWALNRFRWYRRFCGGHWELWYCEATHGAMWDQRIGCFREIGLPPCGRGTPVCEDHR